VKLIRRGGEPTEDMSKGLLVVKSIEASGQYEDCSSYLFTGYRTTGIKAAEPARFAGSFTRLVPTSSGGFYTKPRPRRGRL